MLRTFVSAFLSVLLVAGVASAKDSRIIGPLYRDGGKTTSFPLRMFDCPWMTASLVDYDKLPRDAELRVTEYPKDAMLDIQADGQWHIVTLYGVAWMGEGSRCTIQSKWKAASQKELEEIKQKHPKAQPDLVFVAMPTGLSCTERRISTGGNKEVKLIDQAPVDGQIFMMGIANAANLSTRGAQRVMINGVEHLRVNALSLFVVFNPFQKRD